MIAERLVCEIDNRATMLAVSNIGKKDCTAVCSPRVLVSCISLVDKAIAVGVGEDLWTESCSCSELQAANEPKKAIFGENHDLMYRTERKLVGSDRSEEF